MTNTLQFRVGSLVMVRVPVAPLPVRAEVVYQLFGVVGVRLTAAPHREFEVDRELVVHVFPA
jgi:hypothetical protein